MKSSVECPHWVYPLILSNLFLIAKEPTQCQNERRKALLKPGSSESEVVISCKPDGSFSPIQCDKSVGDCWCADKNGVEIPGTRTTGIVRCPPDGQCFSLSALLLSIYIKMLCVVARRWVIFCDCMKQRKSLQTLSTPWNNHWAYRSQRTDRTLKQSMGWSKSGHIPKSNAKWHALLKTRHPVPIERNNMVFI